MLLAGTGDNEWRTAENEMVRGVEVGYHDGEGGPLKLAAPELFEPGKDSRGRGGLRNQLRVPPKQPQLWYPQRGIRQMEPMKVPDLRSSLEQRITVPGQRGIPELIWQP